VSVVAQGPLHRPHSDHLDSGATWAQQAMQALTGGASISSVTEEGTVTKTVGGVREQGSITLTTNGLMSSESQVSTESGQLSEIRTWDGANPSGQWTGPDGQQHQMTQQNCWTDAVWFFPAMSLLSDYLDPNLVFTDVGQVQYSGGTVEHIEVYRAFSFLPPYLQQQMQGVSQVDYYLDSQTALPVAMAFSVYGDDGAEASVPAAVTFSQYQPVSGIQVPYEVHRLLNGAPFLQIAITNASVSIADNPIRK